MEQLVPPDKLCHVDLEACPKFCTLLSRLSSHYLSRDGTDLKSVAKLEKVLSSDIYTTYYVLLDQFPPLQSMLCYILAKFQSPIQAILHVLT